MMILIVITYLLIFSFIVSWIVGMIFSWKDFKSNSPGVQLKNEPVRRFYKMP